MASEMTTATDTKARIEAASRATAAKIASMLWHAHDFEVDTKWLTAEIQAAMREQVEALSSSASSETPRFPYTIRGSNGSPDVLCRSVESVIAHAEHLGAVCVAHYARIQELEAALASAETQEERPDAEDEAFIDRSWERFKAADDAAKGSSRDIIRTALDPFGGGDA